MITFIYYWILIFKFINLYVKAGFIPKETFVPKGFMCRQTRYDAKYHLLNMCYLWCKYRVSIV